MSHLHYYGTCFTAAQVLRTYSFSLDYLSTDMHPIVPRQAEIALHAIEREGGRTIEGEQIVGYYLEDVCAEVCPAVYSPLRISHRLSITV